MAGKKQRRMQNQIEQFEAEKRSALFRIIAPIVVIVVVIIVKLTLVSQGVAWASDMLVNGAFYLLAIVFAGVCGLGARDWSRANTQINQLKAEAYRKKKR